MRQGFRSNGSSVSAGRTRRTPKTVSATSGRAASAIPSASVFVSAPFGRYSKLSARVVPRVVHAPEGYVAFIRTTTVPPACVRVKRIVCSLPAIQRASVRGVCLAPVAERTGRSPPRCRAAVRRCGFQNDPGTGGCGRAYHAPRHRPRRGRGERIGEAARAPQEHAHRSFSDCRCHSTCNVSPTRRWNSASGPAIQRRALHREQRRFGDPRGVHRGHHAQQRRGRGRAARRAQTSESALTFSASTSQLRSSKVAVDEHVHRRRVIRPRPAQRHRLCPRPWSRRPPAKGHCKLRHRQRKQRGLRAHRNITCPHHLQLALRRHAAARASR